jgi:hypothetical protein
VPAVVADTEAQAREGAAWFPLAPRPRRGPNLTPEQRALALETFRPMLQSAHAGRGGCRD